MESNELARIKELINQSKTLAENEKNIILKHCAGLNKEFLELYKKQQQKQHISKLEKLEAKHPTIVAMLDIISRTFSRLGV